MSETSIQLLIVSQRSYGPYTGWPKSKPLPHHQEIVLYIVFKAHQWNYIFSNYSINRAQ